MLVLCHTVADYYFSWQNLALKQWLYIAQYDRIKEEQCHSCTTKDCLQDSAILYCIVVMWLSRWLLTNLCKQATTCSLQHKVVDTQLFVVYFLLGTSTPVKLTHSAFLITQGHIQYIILPVDSKIKVLCDCKKQFDCDSICILQEVSHRS